MPSPRVIRPLILGALLLAVSPSNAPRGASASSLVLLGGFPTFHQQHALTCESSAASMGTRGAITEGRLMSVIPRNPNPNLGFRGDPNGIGGLANYGVYAAPVRNALSRFGYQSRVMTYGSDADIKRSLR